MKETNDKVYFELTNMVTGEKHRWKLREHAVPTQSLLYMKDGELRDEHAAYIEKHNIPKKDGQAVLDDVDEKHIHALTAIHRRIQKNLLDELMSMMELVGKVPEGYTNARELLIHSIGDWDIPAMIRSLFMKRSGSTTISPGRGTNLIRFLRPNGEEFNPLTEPISDRVKVQDSAQKK